MKEKASEEALALFADGGLRVAAAARASGLSRSVLYELMQRGVLPYAKVGAARIIPRRALMALLAEGLTAPPDVGRG